MTYKAIDLTTEDLLNCLEACLQSLQDSCPGFDEAFEMTEGRSVSDFLDYVKGAIPDVPGFSDNELVECIGLATAQFYVQTTPEETDR